MSMMLSGPVALLAAALAPTDFPPEVTDGMYITLEEVRANSARTFAAFAGPRGNAVSKKDFVSTRLPANILPQTPDRTLLSSLFKGLDANGDDRLTRQEWNSRIERDLGFADQNSDGRVTLKELANARGNMSVGDALGMLF